MTATFLGLSTGSAEVNDDHLASLKPFTILRHDCPSIVVNINDACRELFIMKGKHRDAVPSTRCTLAVGELVSQKSSLKRLCRVLDGRVFAVRRRPAVKS